MKTSKNDKRYIPSWLIIRLCTDNSNIQDELNKITPEVDISPYCYCYT